MPPRGARAAVSTPAEREPLGALTTAVGPAPDPVGPAGNSADGMAPPVVSAAPPLGESQGLEPAGAATEAQGAAEADNTEGKTNGNAGAVLDQLRDEAGARVNTAHAEPASASKTLLGRFKSRPATKKGMDTSPFEKLLPNALLYAREAHKCSDGISKFVTFSTFAPRPASYQAMASLFLMFTLCIPNRPSTSSCVSPTLFLIISVVAPSARCSWRCEWCANVVDRH